MLSDITIGQFFPGESAIHKLDPRTKIILTMLFIFMLFAASSPVSLAPGVAYVFFVLALSKIPPTLVAKSIKPLIPIILITTLINLFLYKGETVIRLGILKISDTGIEISIFTVIRVIFLIFGTSLLTYTTSPIMLTDAIERLLSPLKKLGFPVHDLAMMMTIALRFIPTLIDETDKIMSAQKARGADLETGSIVSRARALVPILIPLFVSAFKRAEELALAMECRCYNGDKGRTRMKQLKYSKRDAAAYLVSLLFLAAVFALNHLFNDFSLFG